MFPTVISFRPATPTLYSSGFKNPSGGSPALIRTSLSSATTPANVGEDADVPPTWPVWPWKKIRKKSPCAATSG